MGSDGVINRRDNAPSMQATLNNFNNFEGVRKMPSITLSKEQETKIIQFYLNPNSVAETARHFGFSRTFIDKLLEKHCIKKHSPQVYWELKQIKTKQTTLEHFGVENAFQADYSKEKARQTKLERYGSETYVNTDKIKQTNLDKYGVDNYTKTEEYKQKTAKTNLKKYGTKSPMQVKAIKQKAIDTCRGRYGVDNPMQNSEITAKAKQTCLARYGVEHFSQTKDMHYLRKNCYYIDDLVFDSLPELAVYIYAIDHNKSIKRNTVRLPYNYNNKTHYYFPDFEYEGNLLEIKGDHFFNEKGILCNPFDKTLDSFCAAKYKCMIDNNVVIWRSKDYQFAVDYFNSKYNKEDFRTKGA